MQRISNKQTSFSIESILIKIIKIKIERNQKILEYIFDLL